MLKQHKICVEEHKCFEKFNDRTNLDYYYN